MRKGTPRFVERGFESRRVRVGPEEHGDAVPGDAVGVRVPARFRDGVGFGVVVVVTSDRRGCAVGTHRLGFAAPVARRIAERDLGDRHHRRRAPVVPLQHDRRAARERALEGEQRPGVGAGEGVDRLRGVADDRQILGGAEPRPQQSQLQRRGVLEFVDEEVTESPTLPGCEFLVAGDGVGATDRARRRSR